jgi:hypothetical protein
LTSSLAESGPGLAHLEQLVGWDVAQRLPRTARPGDLDLAHEPGRPEPEVQAAVGGAGWLFAEPMSGPCRSVTTTSMRPSLSRSPNAAPRCTAFLLANSGPAAAVASAKRPLPPRAERPALVPSAWRVGQGGFR